MMVQNIREYCCHGSKTFSDSSVITLYITLIKYLHWNIKGLSGEKGSEGDFHFFVVSALIARGIQAIRNSE